MSPTLDEVLDTAGSLEERLATVRDPHEQTILEHKKAHVDFAAFGLFKAAHLGQALGDFGKPLAWGVGLGLPALGVGHALLSDAHRQGDALIENARNQAMLTALGVGGLKALGGAAQSLLAPRAPTDPDGFKLGADRQGLQKLAALMLLDDVLEKEFAAADGHEKQALAECLFINRAHGTALLRKLRR